MYAENMPKRLRGLWVMHTWSWVSVSLVIELWVENRDQLPALLRPLSVM